MDANRLEARRRFLAGVAACGLTAPFGAAVWAAARQAGGRVTPDMIQGAARLAGLTFTDAEQQGMTASLNRILTRADDLHRDPPGNDVPSPISTSGPM